MSKIRIIGLLGQANSGKDAVAQMIAPVHYVWFSSLFPTDIDQALAALATTNVAQRKTQALKPAAVQIALADPIKVIAYDLWQFSIASLWGPSQLRSIQDHRYPRWHAAHDQDGAAAGWCRRCGGPVNSDACMSYLTPREACQIIGTEVGRTLYVNTWVDRLLRTTQHPVRCGEQFADTFVISDVRFLSEVQALLAAGAEVWRVDRPGAGLAGAAGEHASEMDQQRDADAINRLITRTISNDSTLAVLRERVRTALC